jgi:cytochrome c-type biogenesis protein
MLGLSDIGIFTAFGAGVVSFLSPCVLPLVPGYVSYVAGHAGVRGAEGGLAVSRLPALGMSVAFIFGFSTVFVLLGASATALGQLLLGYRYELNIVGGGIVILFGLVVLGLLRPTWLMRDFRFHTALPGGRPVAAYVLGLAFAFGWSPCIGPILGAILTLSATSATVHNGIALLAVYSLGLGVPFLLAALFTDALMARLKAIGRIGRSLHLLAGVAMVVMGLAMITGQLSVFAYWLLDAFPALTTVG